MRRINFNNYTINIDDAKLLSLGFKQIEIDNLYKLLNNSILPSNNMIEFGYSYEQSRRIRYMFDICCGKVTINNTDEIIKHLKKLNTGECKIGIQDLAISKITEVPRIALVAGIVEEPYTIYNSKNYDIKDGIYKVINVTAKKIVVETKRRPKLEYNSTGRIDGVLEIKGVKADDRVVISFDKSVCRLCNRYIIVASFRRPEFHHGMYEIICSEGTRLYVYATTMGVRSNVKYNMTTQRIYSFGFFKVNIEERLNMVTKKLYSMLNGVMVNRVKATQEYIMLDKVRKDIDLSDLEITM